MSANPVDVERERVLPDWTRRDLALAARVDPKTLNEFVGGRRRPHLGTVRALCLALEIRLADVIEFGE